MTCSPGDGRALEASCRCGWEITSPVRGRTFQERALAAFAAVAHAAYVQRRRVEIAGGVRTLKPPWSEVEP